VTDSILEGLVAVDIRTTADGPIEDDVFFVLRYANGAEHAIPQTEDSGDLLGRLQSLPGFDNEAFIASMGSTDPAVFPVWRAPAH
jgi:hypothetical protein